MAGRYEAESLDIAGHRGQPVPNLFFRQRAGTDHVAVVFPGSGYTCRMPLLNYPSLLLVGRGADVAWIEYAYGQRADFQQAPSDERRRWLQADGNAALETVLAVRRYERLTLIGKSLGTLVIGDLLGRGLLAPRTEVVWLTPLLGNDVLRGQIEACRWPALGVIGTLDPHYDPARLAEVTARSGWTELVIEGGDHSLEVEGDVWRSLDALRRVVSAVDSLLG